MCIALRAVPVKLFLPFHHVCLAPVFRDEPADAVAAFTGALGAFDAQQVEFSFDITEDDIGPPHYEAPRGLSLLYVLTSTADPCGFRRLLRLQPEV
jgi:hypothetical protein